MESASKAASRCRHLARHGTAYGRYATLRYATLRYAMPLPAVGAGGARGVRVGEAALDGGAQRRQSLCV